MALIDLSRTSVDLTCDLIRYPSITPQDAHCLNDLASALEAFGCQTHLITFQDTKNLYAQWVGQGKSEGSAKHLMFAGHVDVVPPGNEQDWHTPPFQPTIQQGVLYGRGVADMKSAIACFIKVMQTL